MRTFRASSFISRIIPNAFITISLVGLIWIVFLSIALSNNHIKGQKSTTSNGIITILLGLLIIGIAYSATRDALKYTHGTEKATAVVSDVEIYHGTGDESNEYSYTVDFTYEEKEISVIMRPTHRLKLEEGDNVNVYFYPDEIFRVEYPAVVAVDYEVQQAKENIYVGIASCIFGILLIYIAKCKEGLLGNGYQVTATVIKIITSSSGSDSQTNTVNKKFICEGRNPKTGLLQTFKTSGGRFDFLAYIEGDTVHVFVHKDFDKFYVINI